jgi:hypothetical protein
VSRPVIEVANPRARGQSDRNQYLDEIEAAQAAPLSLIDVSTLLLETLCRPGGPHAGALAGEIGLSAT